MTLLDKIKKAITNKRCLTDKDPTVSLPQTYFLELTNHCNLRCLMCNFHSPSVIRSREKGFMQPDMAKRLLHEIACISTKKTWIALHGAGEPLLHKGLLNILQEAPHSQHLDIGFLTNTVLLDAETSKKILDTSISWIGFSIDGIDREKFNRYRRGAEYELVVKNALNFVELARKYRPDLKLVVNMTVQDEMKKDVPEFVKFWLDTVDEVCISPCRPIGSRDNPGVKELPLIDRIPCYMLFTMMVICWDGSVALCCEDWFNDGNMGNVTKNTIEEIWYNAKFINWRALHREGKYNRINLCRDCNSWYNVEAKEYDSEFKCHVKKTAWQNVFFYASDLQ